MPFKRFVVGASVLAMTLATTAQAETRNIDDVPAPDKATPMAQWTAAQQWSSRGTGRGVAQWGYSGRFGMIVFADEMGDKLSELGRVTLIANCFEYGKTDTTASLLWAICGPDVKAFDMNKLEAELQAEGISQSSKESTLDEVKRILDNAKKIGEVVEAAAKDDPGIAQLLKLPEQAKAEWAKYIGANKAAFERYLALKDAVRSGKSNHKSFAGCWEATQPPFAKLVKATKFPWEVSGDYLPAYVNTMLTSTENYITVASFAACAYSIDAGGEAIAAAALSQERGGTIRVGWRTIAVAKALDPKFKPKFAERSLNWGEWGMPRDWADGRFKMGGINDILKMQTPSQGALAKVKKEGDVTKLSFKGNKVESCLNWKETRKVQSIAANGDPIYERVCTKRGMVDNQETATEIATKFATGVAPGTSIWIVGRFPVAVWKGKKFIAVLGQPNTK